MINRFFLKFSLRHEREEAGAIVEAIEKGVVFRGTNLWVLIFAIFIASLGLNVNSTAVIIGAMLISPLMGPIMGLGLSVGINDLALLRKSFYNYLIATGVALATSTVFFLLSPLNDAHSEILARTSPNIYDVLIALFGGLAGIIATASKQKGNVIPGVAIATALMPPLCTAGYGLATLKFNFFIGAFYLFIINTVFIALATFVTTRFMKFPYRRLPDRKADARANRIIWTLVILTVIPSIYLGYDIVEQDRFIKKATNFIAVEGNFHNDYMLNKKIDPKTNTISLIYGGDVISAEAIERVKARLQHYGLAGANLEIHQGFAYLASVANENSLTNEKSDQLSLALKAKEAALQTLQQQADSLRNASLLEKQVYLEIKTQYNDLDEAILGSARRFKMDTDTIGPILLLRFRQHKTSKEKTTITNWLKIRLQRQDLTILFL